MRRRRRTGKRWAEVVFCSLLLAATTACGDDADSGTSGDTSGEGSGDASTSASLPASDEEAPSATSGLDVDRSEATEAADPDPGHTIGHGASSGPPPTAGDPRFVLSPEAIAFDDDVAPGTTRTQSLQLTALGREAVTIDGYDMDGEGFSIEPVEGAFPVTLEHGDILELEVHFVPEEAREYYAEVTFRGSTDAGRHRVELWGNLSCVDYVDGPTIGRQEGPMTVGERREFSLVLTNCSSLVPLDIVSVDVLEGRLRDGPDPAGWFSFPPPLEEVERVEPGAQWSYTVAFEPQAAGEFAVHLDVWLDHFERAGGWGRPLPGGTRQIGARIVPEVVEAE